MANIVVTDGRTLNPGDLSWQKLQALGDCRVYDYTPPEELAARAAEAHILIVNKTPVTAEALAQLPHLKCIVASATGYNNIDLKAAKERGVPVCNAVGYSTPAVAQHVFALLLALTNRVAAHHLSVKEGQWSRGQDFSYTLQPIPELSGRTLGIYGFGRIGQQVAQIGLAFGMKILAAHKHPERDARQGVAFTSLSRLFAQSDVITLHAPLSKENELIINRELLRAMKPDAFLINTGRGGLVHEADLAMALNEGWLAGAALDVLSAEPPPEGHPLLHAPNCLITPHMAWSTQAARQRLMDITIANVQSYLEGQPQHVVNP
ncbi:D-2-hydroxyacid dehydrogenase [Phaeodactylibacter luteus]|uniref:D-2-hydroxyacid dehydrogenase n=1 Tax=Phaeodactylibacter luteus TaxID=1564516 RepID=A0A5C6RLU9_9BACT|nr:D-2-hydroxyacid dehydrogenase [Phaeodactylibacter luteus]TXB62600.1 D-2-hydroxyacid dehydrogenase [Phaeodactylibacter luteus]